MNFSDLKLKVNRLLEDDDIPAETLHDGVTAALEAILPWYASRSVHTITGDGDTEVFDLPPDMYEIDAVMLSASGDFIPQTVLQQGNTRGQWSSWGDWTEYPHGSVWLSKAPTTGEELTVFYRANWPAPEDLADDDHEFTLPQHLNYPVAIYATAHCLTSKAVETANIRQFGTKVDSGNPGHNPIADRVVFLHQLFHTEMDRHPRQIAGARA
jgi:hypothetical protein